MMFLGNPKPKSSAKLQQRIQRAMDGLPPVRQKILHQNIHNTILLQFLEGLGVAKGGGALSLRMPLPKGRVSRDFDAHLVQHDRVQRPVEPVAGQFAPLGRGLRGGDGRAGVHEPVHGDALHVQGGYPRGGEREDVPIGVEAPPVPDERAFPGARLAGEEHGAARVVQRPERVRVVMVSAFIHAGVYASDGPGGTRYASPGPGMRAVCIR